MNSVVKSNAQVCTWQWSMVNGQPRLKVPMSTRQQLNETGLVWRSIPRSANAQLDKSPNAYIRFLSTHGNLNLVSGELTNKSGDQLRYICLDQLVLDNGSQRVDTKCGLVEEWDSLDNVLTSLFSHIDFPVIKLSPTEVIEFVNHDFINVSEYRPEELVGKHVSKVMELANGYDLTLPGLSNPDPVRRLNSKHGASELYITRSLKIEQGPDQGTIVILERKSHKRRSKDRRIRELWYDRILESMPSGVLVLDKDDLRILHSNDSAEKILERSKIKLFGTRFEDLLVERGIIDQLFTKLDGTEVFGEAEFSIRTTTEERLVKGKTRHVVWSGGIEGYLVLFEDLTSTKALEENLKIAQVRYNLIMENTRAFVVHLDTKGDILFANHHFNRSVNLEHAPVNPSFFRLLGSHAEQENFRKSYQLFLSSNMRSWSWHAGIKAKGDRIIEGSWELSKVDGLNEECILIGIDQTEQVRNQRRVKALELSNRLLNEKRQTKVLMSMMEGVESDRQRMARELHDGVGQIMVTCKRMISHLCETKDKDGACFKENLEKLKSWMDEAISETRRLAADLSPSVLVDFGVSAGLSKIVDMYKAVGVNIGYMPFGNYDKRFPKEIEHNFYRVAQEALTNAVKHAPGSRVQVFYGYQDEMLSLEVADDGEGVGQPQARPVDKLTGNGMANMRMRAKIIGADLILEDASSSGTSIRLIKTITQQL